jgi:hypothetical protein
LNLSEKLRRGSSFELFKGKRSEVTLNREGHGERTFVHFAEVLEERVRWSEFSVENPKNSEDHRIRDKTNPSLWYPESTWVVDLDLFTTVRSFQGFRVRKSGVQAKTFG